MFPDPYPKSIKAAFVRENQLTDYVEAVYIQLVEEYIKRNNGKKAR